MNSAFEIRFDNARLRGESAGFGIPVVFLHAGVADRRMWAGQLAALAAEGYHAVAYDRRGHGETEAPDEPFSHLVDLEAVLDQLGLQAAVLVGSSAGGGLAIDFAIEHPERVVGLVLVATALSGAPEPELPEAAEALRDARDYALERGNRASVNRLEAQMWLDGPLVEGGRVDGPARELFLAMNEEVLARPPLTREEPADPAVDNLDRVTAPVLLVAGDLDFPHILERHAELEAELEEAFAVVMEGTAHLPSVERPEEFNQVLLEFLEATTAAAV